MGTIGQEALKWNANKLIIERDNYDSANMSWDCEETFPFVGLILDTISAANCETIIPNSDLQTRDGYFPDETELNMPFWLDKNS